MPLTEETGQGGYLEENLSSFCFLLRNEGLPVGTTELIDALHALTRIDSTRRMEFKAALQATLVKSSRDRAVFDRLFDQYFVPAEQHQMRSELLERQKEKRVRSIDQASSDLQFKGETLQLNPEELYQYSALSSDQRDKLLDFVTKTEQGKNVQPRFRPLLETVVKSHLRYCRNQDDRVEPGKGISGSGQGAGSGGPDELALRDVDIRTIAAADLPAAEQLLQRLSRKLAVKLMRRRRYGSRSGPIDLRRSLRDNMRFGGVIFNIRRRPKRRHRQQILLLCDFSGSMKRYSTFVIHFLYGLREVVRDLSCFSFSDRLQDLTPDIKDRVALKIMLDRVVRRSKTWGGGTDIGCSLEDLRTKHAGTLNSRTTVIVVSDTRTVSLNAAYRELSLLREEVRRIIWLNPLPPQQWADYRSVELFSETAEMWPCSTIAQLEDILIGRL